MLESERNKEIDTVDERMLNCIVVTFHSFLLTSHLHLPLLCLSNLGKNMIELCIQELNRLFIGRKSALQIYVYMFKNLS